MQVKFAELNTMVGLQNLCKPVSRKILEHRLDAYIETSSARLWQKGRVTLDSLPFSTVVQLYSHNGKMETLNYFAVNTRDPICSFFVSRPIVAIHSHIQTDDRQHIVTIETGLMVIGRKLVNDN